MQPQMQKRFSGAHAAVRMSRMSVNNVGGVVRRRLKTRWRKVVNGIRFICRLRVFVRVHPKLTVTERTMIHKVFTDANINHSPISSVQRVQEVLQHFGHNLTADEIFARLMEVRWHPGKVLHVHQLTKFFYNLKQRHENTRVTDTCEAFMALGGEQNGTGFVDADRLRDVVDEFKLNIDIEALIAEADTDGSGEIEFDEFAYLFATRIGGQRGKEAPMSVLGSASRIGTLLDLTASRSDFPQRSHGSTPRDSNAVSFNVDPATVLGHPQGGTQDPTSPHASSSPTPMKSALSLEVQMDKFKDRVAAKLGEHVGSSHTKGAKRRALGLAANVSTILNMNGQWKYDKNELCAAFIPKKDVVRNSSVHSDTLTPAETTMSVATRSLTSHPATPGGHSLTSQPGKATPGTRPLERPASATNRSVQFHPDAKTGKDVPPRPASAQPGPGQPRPLPHGASPSAQPMPSRQQRPASADAGSQRFRRRYGGEPTLDKPQLQWSPRRSQFVLDKHIPAHTADVQPHELHPRGPSIPVLRADTQKEITRRAGMRGQRPRSALAQKLRRTLPSKSVDDLCERPLFMPTNKERRAAMQRFTAKPHVFVAHPVDGAPPPPCVSEATSEVAQKVLMFLQTRAGHHATSINKSMAGATPQQASIPPSPQSQHHRLSSASASASASSGRRVSTPAELLAAAAAPLSVSTTLRRSSVSVNNDHSAVLSPSSSVAAVGTPALMRKASLAVEPSSAWGAAKSPSAAHHAY